MKRFEDVIYSTVRILEQAPEDPALAAPSPGGDLGAVPVPVEPNSALPGEEDNTGEICEGKSALIELARKSFLAGLYHTSSDKNEMFQEPGDYGIVSNVTNDDNIIQIEDILNYIVRDFYPDTDIE